MADAVPGDGRVTAVVGTVVVDEPAPLPSWPNVSDPQQRTDPLEATTHVCEEPAATAEAVNELGSVSAVGGPKVPTAAPNWPTEFRPQQTSCPAVVIAQV